MEEGQKTKEKTEDHQKAYEILSWANKGEDITIRDEQYELPSILDSVKRSRKRGFRFRLIDSGKFSGTELEWLAKAGADLYTSDEARQDIFELELLNKACISGKSFLAYFHRGPLEAEEGREQSNSISYLDLQNLAVSGAYFHLSNREQKRDLSHLVPLAFSCQKGGSWLVYYHHGPLEAPLEELGRAGAWIHVSDKSLKEDEDLSLLAEIIRTTRIAGTNLVLHVEKGLDILIAKDIVRLGAFVLFKFSLFDRRSPFRKLEKESRKRKLDFRAFYLYPHFLP